MIYCAIAVLVLVIIISVAVIVPKQPASPPTQAPSLVNDADSAQSEVGVPTVTSSAPVLSPEETPETAPFFVPNAPFDTPNAPFQLPLS